LLIASNRWTKDAYQRGQDLADAPWLRRSTALAG
jgi:hypothetical protein